MSRIFAMRNGAAVNPCRLAAAVQAGIANQVQSEQVSVATKNPVDVESQSGCAETLDFEAVEESPSLVFGTGTKSEQAKLVRVFGERMRQARELSNMSQSVAAKRLGYANPSKLSKVEGATDTNSIPLWLIPRAAKVYEVSVDFLFGLSEDFEVGVPRVASNWMLDAWEQARLRDIAAMEELHRVVAGVATNIDGFGAATSGIAEAITRFRVRNPNFDDCPASAMVLTRLGKLEAVARDAESVLKRFRLGRHAAGGARG